MKNRFLNKTEGGSGSTTVPARKDSTSSVASSTTTGTSSTNRSRPYQSRYTTKAPEKPAEPAKEEEEDEDESEESESSEEESEEESDSPPPPTPPTKKTTVPEPKSRMEKTDIGPLLARSANARDTPPSSTSNANSTSASSTTSSLYGARRRANEEPHSPTQSTPSSALSAYRSSRSRISSPVRDPDPEPPSTRRYGTSSTSSTSGLGSSRFIFLYIKKLINKNRIKSNFFKPYCITFPDIHHLILPQTTPHPLA